MDIQEKVCEFLHWTQLADIGIYKRSCKLVVTDSVDSHLPRVDCFQLKKGKFGISRSIWDMLLWKVYGRLWARLDWLSIRSIGAFQHAMGNFLSSWTTIGFPKRKIFSVDLPTFTNSYITLNLQNTLLGLIKYNQIAVCSHVEKARKRWILPKKTIFFLFCFFFYRIATDVSARSGPLEGVH